VSSVTPDLAVLASFSGEGGVERMLLNLINELAARGLRVHLLLIRSSSRHLEEIDPDVELIRLGSGHTATSLPSLVRYLRGHRPTRMLVAKDRAGRLAVLARMLSGVDCRIVVRLGTNLSAAMEHKSSLQLWLRGLPIRLLYPRIDHIIAVSEGVRQDTMRVSGVSPERVSVVRNPVLTPRVYDLAQKPPTHPWLQNKILPVILGAGRLTRQKDFTTLIRAFAELSANLDCRLIILGDGREEADLKALTKQLNLEDKVSFPGFTRNPYTFMAHADLFVLSSRWEGSPNVLTEAMTLGTPVVSTQCPSGPDEILDQGRHGPLVPVGDWQALANAMAQTLQHPPYGDNLRRAVQEYEVATSATHYLGILETKTDAAVD
jgi:glycosyltransferase involved in cell wall biosynthesis